MRLLRAAVVSAFVVPSMLLVACSEPPASAPAALEIGLLAPDGTFVPLADGDTVRATLGSMGTATFMPSLRAVGIDPRGPEPTVEVDVGGVVMAANAAAPRGDMVADGTGYVLPDLRVQFQTAPCCYACSEGTIVARLRDNTGKQFEGQVTVQLDAGAGCPDLTTCCATADACSVPSLTHVCP